MIEVGPWRPYFAYLTGPLFALKSGARLIRIKRPQVGFNSKEAGMAVSRVAIAPACPMRNRIQ
jgi:hypothetical protein